MFYEKIVQIFKLKDLRDKIFFIFGILIIFRIMANIPVPGINHLELKRFFSEFQIFGLANVFTGGALDNMSILMLGLAPFITALIIFQLLTMIFPNLKKMYYEEGEMGRQKFNQYARLLTVPLAIMQTFGMLKLLQQQNVIGNLSPLLFMDTILTVTAATVFLMWMGELISEKKIGNGVSILIFAGIVSAIPINIGQMIKTFSVTQVPYYLIFFFLAFLIIAFVISINEAKRNIPISYAKRVRGMRIYGGSSTYLPINLNPAGVIPIIFAISLLLFPPLIGVLLKPLGGHIAQIGQAINDFFINPWTNGVLYFILVFIFTYFYTAVIFEPDSISKNLQKSGAFVPGIRPGENTSKFISYTLNRILFVAGFFLGLVAVLPQIVAGFTHVSVFRFLVGGTSLLIVVAVVLDVIKRIDAQLEMHNYEKF